MLAVYAHEQGFVAPGYERQDVIEKIKLFMDGGELEFPLKCPNSTVLDSIYQWSRDSETWAMSIIKSTTSLSDQERADFDQDWETTLDSKIFCGVDVEEVLNQEEWQAFFKKTFAP